MREGGSRWVVNPPGEVLSGDRVVALDLQQVRTADRPGVSSMPFHELVRTEVEPLGAITVDVPRWRGYGFLSVLEWLVCAKLGEAGRSEVIWRAERRGGATGVRRILTERGWEFREHKAKAMRIFAGATPRPGPFPHPPTFEARLGARDLSFASGWGVFSESRIDAGTQLLFDVAAQQPFAPVVLDVGVGYGPLAIGLVATGKAGRAVGTDVDSVALALAEMNAASAGVPVRLDLTDDPSSDREATLVVCNFPTHTDGASADRLVAALTRLASRTRVLVVVHASLEARFTDRFAAAGAGAEVEARSEHAVMRLDGRTV